jgi:signal transduction histidine kinase
MRKRLLLLTVVGILPLATMSWIALLVLAQQQRSQVEQVGLEVARALSTAVDAEIMHSVLALEAMASTFEHLELGTFDDAARRVLASQPHWAALVVYDRTGVKVFQRGDVVVNGDALEPLDPEALDRLRGAQRPLVGRLTGRTGASLHLPVRVPVVRNGQLVYVLSAKVKPDGILAVVNRQQLPADWVVSVFDAAEIRVARSRQHEEYLGQPPAPELQVLMRSEQLERMGVARTHEGDPVHAAYSRSPRTGFTVAIGMPPSFVNAGAYRSLLTLGSGILLSVLLGGLAARIAARGVIRPIGLLREAAQALGRREPVRAPPTAIEELRQVGEALALAAEERARGEAERERLLRREREARSVAEVANRAKDEFLSMLGHELRNPLGAISNASRLLADSRVDEEASDRAKEIIARQVVHLARLTDDLLDAGRALTGKIVLRLTPLDLAAATARVLGTGWIAGPAANRRILEDLEPVWIEADPTRVEQIIANLLGNAVKYSRDGGTIGVSVRREGEQAVLCVTDDGVGMEPELVGRVFDSFVQGDRALDREHGGLGIGLTMVRRLALLHGGSVQAHSDGPDRGSAFSVRFPVTSPPSESPAPAPPEAPIAKRSILLVEDNEDARDSLRRLLELDGHRVTAASDGASALASVRTALAEVALIDLGLPGMDGYELARRIRADMGDRVLLVALTGYGLPADRARSQAAGFDVHVVKPVDRETLEKVLRRI